jgi:peptide/nickel transport system ATP-binding protein
MIRDLSKTFCLQRRWPTAQPRLVQAVDRLSFDVAPGETFGLIGESGSGKSTVARLICGLLPPTAGRIVFAGADRTTAPSRATQRHHGIQMVFQDPYSSLNACMPVAAILAEPLHVLKLARGAAAVREEVQHLLACVGLAADAAARYPHAFSGGERQRIGIARALSVSPRLIVADEAVSALDVSVQAQILNLLKDLQAELGLTYLFVAHNLSVVQYISDHVAVMYVGKVVELAERRELYQRPRHPYTEALMSAVPRPDPRSRAAEARIRLEGEVADPAAPPTGCYFHPRCRYAEPRCATDEPALRDVGGGHTVACHRAEEISLRGLE